MTKHFSFAKSLSTMKNTFEIEYGLILMMNVIGILK